MISLEICIERPLPGEILGGSEFGFYFDEIPRSDRWPSHWEESIIKPVGGPVVHVFDRAFIGSTKGRWLWDDVEDHFDSFRFIPELEQQYPLLLEKCFDLSITRRIWVMTDMERGPPPKLFAPQKLEEHLVSYRRDGLRNNSAWPLTQ